MTRFQQKDKHGKKPFVFGVATSGDNFTDREKETQRLLLNFTHGVNTILISPRRWGKTSLVKKVAQLAQTKTRKIVYLDIFSCRTESEVSIVFFATSVLKQTSSKWDEWVENTKQFLAHINPKISIGTDPYERLFLSLLSIACRIMPEMISCNYLKRLR